MCTAATYKTNDFYMGRTLDYEFSYGDEITVTPRNYSFTLRHGGKLENHYAIIGMAHVAGNYSLYYDAINEKGVGMAGLNFVGNAAYADVTSDRDNVAQFEFIPWILSQCATLSEAQTLLERMTLVDTPFSEQFPLAQLHWIISDQTGSITVESMADGLHIYENPVGVLTNNPPFPQQMFQLNNFMHLSLKQPVNAFSDDLVFFHILGSVDQQRGCCEVADGKYEITLYTSCCNVTKGIYYYTTYENHQISAVDMHRENLDGDALICYPVIDGEQINYQN